MSRRAPVAPLWSAHPSLSHSFGRLRRKQFVHPSTSFATIRNSYGLVIKLNHVARQHTTVHGHRKGYIEYGGNLECERGFGREFNGGNNIEHWSLYRAPRLGEPRNCHNPGYESGEQFSEWQRASDDN